MDSPFIRGNALKPWFPQDGAHSSQARSASLQQHPKAIEFDGYKFMVTL
jgi:hypothetical protein